jgi:hypothetical protein
MSCILHLKRLYTSGGLALSQVNPKLKVHTFLVAAISKFKQSIDLKTPLSYQDTNIPNREMVTFLRCFCWTSGYISFHYDAVALAPLDSAPSVQCAA